MIAIIIGILINSFQSCSNPIIKRETDRLVYSTIETSPQHNILFKIIETFHQQCLYKTDKCHTVSQSIQCIADLRFICKTDRNRSDFRPFL